MKGLRLTAKRLRAALKYDPASGLFTWRVSAGRMMAGSVAGTIAERGYIRIFLDRRPYLAQRLAWLWMKGKPLQTMAILPREIDHEDTDPANNRWANLRAATRPQNQQNVGARAHNLSGFKWVRTKRHRSGAVSYQANIGQQSFGCFATPKEAHKAARAHAQRQHGAFFNPGEPACKAKTKAARKAPRRSPKPSRKAPGGSRTVSI